VLLFSAVLLLVVQRFATVLFVYGAVQAVLFAVVMLFVAVLVLVVAVLLLLTVLLLFLIVLLFQQHRHEQHRCEENNQFLTVLVATSSTVGGYCCRGVVRGPWSPVRVVFAVCCSWRWCCFCCVF